MRLNLSRIATFSSMDIFFAISEKIEFSQRHAGLTDVTQNDGCNGLLLTYLDSLRSSRCRHFFIFSILLNFLYTEQNPFCFCADMGACGRVLFRA